MFIDEARIEVRGGKGGRGCVAFRREKYVPKGGPSGGSGGAGGSVILKATPQLHTLMDIVQRTIYAAENGRPGEGANRTGRSGEDTLVRVPMGTILHDDETGAVFCDLCDEGQEYVAARGGKGGRGNKSFATATHRTPTEFEEGEEGVARRIHLELKLIADVGLVGLPNAGKSTLLSRVSDAHPKIASYPFTTLEPQLGVVDAPGFRRIVFADLPGLIEGAHEGTGLGDEFLRHIERTRLLVHMVDISPTAMTPAAEAYRTIRAELEAYSSALAQKAEILAGTKTDIGGWEENLATLEEESGLNVLPISGVSGSGMPALMAEVARRLSECS